MATPKSNDDIQTELTFLRDFKSRIREFSHFGDNNRDAIGAQIRVLAGRMELETVHAVFPDEGEPGDEHVHQAAMDAHDWWTGLSDEDAPSEGWKVLL